MSNPAESAPDKAARLGLALVEPEPTELFVDLDGLAALKDFESRYKCFLKVYPDSTVQFTTSSGGNTHAYVTCPEMLGMSMDQRIGLQASLGSDPLREMIAMKHWREGYEWPSVFFERPSEVRRDKP